jgi:alkylhydroperoxidase family enzyme
MPRVQIPDDFAQDPTSYVWSRFAPEVGAAAGGFMLAVYENCALSVREMEAARYRTAHLNGCKLCINMRAARDLPGLIERSGGNPAKAAARKGPDPDEAFYAAIADWRTSPVLTERERMAAEYADRLGQSPKSMEEDDGFWQQMHAVFSDAEIVDLSFAIAMWMGFGRLTHALELDNVCMPTALS